jgi:hypothetical protein
MTDVRPYRLLVTVQGYRPTRRYYNRKRPYTAIERCVYGFVAWTPEQHYREARLPNGGSFLFPGIHAARAEAFAYLARPNVRQVSIRTDQDRTVYLYNRYDDGRISGYAPGDDA